MRTYSRNVRRAWDGDDYRQPKRQRTGHYSAGTYASTNTRENVLQDIDLEDNLERAIRETSVAALSSSPSRKNSTVFSLNDSHHDDDDGSNTITPPSSPPHALQLTPPNIKARKPIFKSLNKPKKTEEAASKSRTEIPPNADKTRNKPTEPLAEIVNSSTQPTSNTISAPDHAAFETQTDSPPPESAISTKPPQVKQNMVQTYLDFGQQNTPVTCVTCQMSYLPNVAEDAQLHKMWHNRDDSGIELGKPFLKSAMKWCYEVPQIPGSVVVVDRKISVPGRRAVQRALEVVNKDLGSVNIKEDELWSQRILEGEGEESGRKCDRYKAFLHIIDGKCVGLCLAERISRAHRVLPAEGESTPVPSQQMQLHSLEHIQRPPSPPMSEDLSEANTTTKPQPDIGMNSTPRPPQFTPQQSYTSDPERPTSTPPNNHVITTSSDATTTNTNNSSSITISDETYPMIVGVSRIWTSNKFRRKGIANNLLECVMNQFIYGMEIERSEIAFSQPTQSGCMLARQWFGADHGWGVYRED